MPNNDDVKARLAAYSKELWKNPEYVAKMRKAASEAMSRTNAKRRAGAYPEWTAKIPEARRKAAQAAHDNPRSHAKILAGLKHGRETTQRTPEFRKQAAKRARRTTLAAWRDGKYAGMNHQRFGTCRFRSKNEQRFSEQLTALGYTWQYEPKTFPVQIGKRMRSYTPDFYVSELNLWIELKGYWRTQHCEKKVRLFAAQNPKLRYTVILGTPGTWRYCLGLWKPRFSKMLDSPILKNI